MSLNPESQDKLVIIVQTTDKSLKIGSISIPQDLFFACGPSRHLQWLTLFDHLEDDEYDGDLTEEDEEMPRIQVMFQINKYQQSNSMPVTRTAATNNATISHHPVIAHQESVKLSPSKQLSAPKRATAYSHSPARELVSQSMLSMRLGTE